MVDILEAGARKKLTHAKAILAGTIGCKYSW
jgi:hypothetical protein